MHLYLYWMWWYSSIFCALLPEGSRFESTSSHCVATLNKLLTHMTARDRANRVPNHTEITGYWKLKNHSHTNNSSTNTIKISSLSDSYLAQMVLWKQSEQHIFQKLLQILPMKLNLNWKNNSKFGITCRMLRRLAHETAWFKKPRITITCCKVS